MHQIMHFILLINDIISPNLSSRSDPDQCLTDIYLIWIYILSCIFMREVPVSCIKCYEILFAVVYKCFYSLLEAQAYSIRHYMYELNMHF